MVMVCLVRIILVFCLICNFGFSQEYQDTVYFDVSWNELPNRENAFFYRITERLGKNRFQVKDYFIGGQVQMLGSYKDRGLEIEQGKFIYYDIHGKITQELAYRKGHYHGICTWYHDTSEKSSVEFYRRGKLKRIELFYPDGAVDSLTVDPNSEAQFPGGEGAYNEFISENLVVPSQELSNIHEKIYVTARIDKKGNVIDVVLEDYINQEIAYLIRKMMNSMPQWVPAKSHNRYVSSKIRIPFTFDID